MDLVRRSARVALLDQTGAVLLINSGFRRPIDGVTSAWFLPGGGVEYRETLLQTAVREIYEETGMTMAPELLVHLAFAEGDGQVGDLRGPMRDDIFVGRAPSKDISTQALEQHERAGSMSTSGGASMTCRSQTSWCFPTCLPRR